MRGNRRTASLTGLDLDFKGRNRMGTYILGKCSSLFVVSWLCGYGPRPLGKESRIDKFLIYHMQNLVEGALICHLARSGQSYCLYPTWKSR